MLRVIIFTALVCFSLMSCSRPTKVNGSSAEAFSKSILAISQDLSSRRKISFIDDLNTLNIYYGGSLSTLDNPSTKFLLLINGRTVESIHREAHAIRVDRTEENIKNLTSKLNVLDKKSMLLQNWHKEILHKLKQLHIANVKFLGVKKNVGIESLTSTISFDVYNSSSYVYRISKASLSGMFGESKRTYPLYDCFSDTFDKSKGRILPHSKRNFRCHVFDDDLSKIESMRISVVSGSINDDKSGSSGEFSLDSSKYESNIKDRRNKIRLELDQECSKFGIETKIFCMHINSTQ